MDYNFRQATRDEVPQIWQIIQQAITRRKNEGSEQWQDGYPNAQIIGDDVEHLIGHVLTEDERIVGYTAVLINDEPAYENIEGKWLTNDDFVVVHRVAIADSHAGKGLARKILSFVEEYALSNNIHSVKADTNFDNPAMLKTLEKLGYTYCGEVFFRGKSRRAYEKVLI